MNNRIAKIERDNPELEITDDKKKTLVMSFSQF